MKEIRYFFRASVSKVRNAKFAAFVLVMLMASYYYVPEIVKVSIDLEYPVTWCIFPFLFNANVFITLFWFGIIYINTDIPFMQYFNMYQVIWTGRRKWMLANIFGMLFRSFAAAAATAVCSILPLISHMELTNDWGKLLKTYVMTNMAETYMLSYQIPYEIMERYTPVQMMLLLILLLTLIGTFMGLLMLVLSLYGSRSLAVAADVLLVLMIFLVLNAFSEDRMMYAKAVPPVWAQVTKINTTFGGFYWLPDVEYMLTFLIIGIFAGTFLCVRRARYVDLHWVNEDA